jgi:hypothetical protein
MKETRGKWEFLNKVTQMGLLVFLLVGLFFSPNMLNNTLFNAFKAILGVISILILAKLVVGLIHNFNQERTNEILEEAWEKANLMDNFRIWNWAEKCGYVSAQLKQNRRGYWVRLKCKTGQSRVEPVDLSAWIQPFAEGIAFMLSALAMFFLLLMEKGNMFNLIVGLLLFLFAYALINFASQINELILSFILYIMCTKRINLLYGKFYSFYDLCMADRIFSTVSLRSRTKELDEFELSFTDKKDAHVYSLTVPRSELKFYLKFR